MPEEYIVNDAGIYDLPDELEALIAYLQNKLSEVPEEFRAKTKIACNREEYSTHFSIYYTRPETVVEQEERARREYERRQYQEQNERRMLAQLKAKFGE